LASRAVKGQSERSRVSENVRNFNDIGDVVEITKKTVTLCTTRKDSTLIANIEKKKKHALTQSDRIPRNLFLL